MRIFLVSFFIFAIGLEKVIGAGISLRLFFLEPCSPEPAFPYLSVRKPKLPLTSRERSKKRKERKEKSRKSRKSGDWENDNNMVPHVMSSQDVCNCRVLAAKALRVIALLAPAKWYLPSSSHKQVQVPPGRLTAQQRSCHRPAFARQLHFEIS